MVSVQCRPNTNKSVGPKLARHRPDVVHSRVLRPDQHVYMQARSQPYAGTHVRTHCKGEYAVVQITTSNLYVVLRKTPEK